MSSTHPVFYKESKVNDGIVVTKIRDHMHRIRAFFECYFQERCIELANLELKLEKRLRNNFEENKREPDVDVYYMVNIYIEFSAGEMVKSWCCLEDTEAELVAIKWRARGWLIEETNGRAKILKLNELCQELRKKPVA